jgi:pilus assembly protein Flp/PilA
VLCILAWSNQQGADPMRALFAKLISDKAGVTAIEYGLIAALIVIGALVAINSVGLNLNLSRTFSTIAGKL